MKTETDFLEKAVINLTIENAKLKDELKEMTMSKDRWFEYYQEKESEILRLENEITTLQLPSDEELKTY